MPRRRRRGGPLQRMVERQIARVLTRGQRFAKFDQIRQRHFWSTYLFAPGGGNPIASAPYDVFKATPWATITEITKDESRTMETT